MSHSHQRFQEALKSAGYQSYKEYLQSEVWKQKKAEFFAVRPRHCWVCSSQDHFEIHHKTYERVTCERLDDLVGLCWKCHDKVHEVCRQKPWIALEDAHKEVAYDFDNRPKATGKEKRRGRKGKKKLNGLNKLRRTAMKSERELLEIRKKRAIANTKAKLYAKVN